MAELTARQAEVFAFLKAHLCATQGMPSKRDICRKFGFTVNAAVQHLKALEKKGVIKLSHKARGIKLVGYKVKLVAI